MMMRSTLYQTNTLTASSLKQQSGDRRQTCYPTRTHYNDCEPTSLCSFSLMLCAQQRSNKYQFHSLWCDPTGARNELMYQYIVFVYLSNHCINTDVFAYLSNQCINTDAFAYLSNQCINADVLVYISNRFINTNVFATLVTDV